MAGPTSRRSKSVRNWLAEVTWVGQDHFVGTDLESHSIIFDATGPDSRGISPMRAVLTSLGACSGMDIIATLRKRKQRVTSLKIFLTGTRPEFGLPKPWRSIQLKIQVKGNNLDEKVLKEAVDDSITRLCSVGATLKQRVKISYGVELTDSVGSSRD